MSEIEALGARLARLEERIERLEQSRDHPAPVVRAPTPAAVDAPAGALDASLIGKSVLIIGGGYLLRALTEMGIVAEAAGIVLGLLYSLAWMIIAGRAMSRGRTSAALFDSVTAALIAASLIWESTARFHLLSSMAASAIALTITLALLGIAAQRHAAAFALIAAVMVTVTCIGIAVATADFRAPLVAATIAGVAMSFVSIRATLLVAAAADMLAIPLIAIVAIAQTPPPPATVEIALLAFAAMWLAAPLMPQAIVATAIGTSGAAIVAAFHGGHPVAVAVTCLVFSTTAYVAASKRLSVAAGIAAAIGTLLLFDLPVAAIMWAAAAAVSAWFGRDAQAACWAVASAIAAGLPQALFTATDPPFAVVVVGVVAAVALWHVPHESRPARYAFLAIATGAAIAVNVGALSGLMTGPALVAVTRTAALAIAAVVLVAISDSVPEAKLVSVVLLVITGAKLLLEDLRAGRAVTIVIALAMYGGALVFVASRRAALRAGATTVPSTGIR